MVFTIPIKICQQIIFLDRHKYIQYNISSQGRRTVMASACLNVGHGGAASESSLVQMNNLFDVTTYLGNFFNATEIDFVVERLLKDDMIPGGVGCFTLSRAGEAVFYYQGKPVAFITRLASEKGCDANVGKWYRKQWYFENYLKKQNPDCNHITFVHASSGTGMLRDFMTGVSMVMTQSFNSEGFNSPNFGGNSIYCFDTDKNEETWTTVSAVITSIVSLTLCKMKTDKLKDWFTE